MEKTAKKKIAGFIDAKLVKEARIFAAQTDDSINRLLAKALREYMDKRYHVIMHTGEQGYAGDPQGVQGLPGRLPTTPEMYEIGLR